MGYKEAYLNSQTFVNRDGKAGFDGVVVAGKPVAIWRHRYRAPPTGAGAEIDLGRFAGGEVQQVVAAVAKVSTSHRKGCTADGGPFADWKFGLP